MTVEMHHESSQLLMQLFDVVVVCCWNVTTKVLDSARFLLAVDEQTHTTVKQTEQNDDDDICE